MEPDARTAAGCSRPRQKLWFWLPLLVLLYFVFTHYRWTPTISHRLVAAAAESDTMRLADVMRFAWDRACLISPYSRLHDFRLEASWQIPRDASNEYNDDAHVLVFVHGRNLVAYDRVSRSRLEFERWPSLCVAREDAVLVRGISGFGHVAWVLIGR